MVLIGSAARLVGGGGGGGGALIAPITEASGFLNFVVMIPTGGSGFDSGGLYLDSLEELKILVLLVSILCFLLRVL